MADEARKLSSLNSDGSTVKQTTLVGLEPPRLRGMSMEEMIKFKRERNEYELLVKEKNRDPGVDIQLVSYWGSIDKRVLRMMWRAKWITAESVETITDSQIKACIESRCVRTFDGINVKEIDSIVKSVKMNMSTVDPESRVWTLALNYEKALEEAGYQNVLEKCPHVAIEHMVRKAEPPLLKTALRDLLRLHRNEGLHKKDFFAFVEKMVGKATEVDQMEKLQKSHSKSKQNEGSKQDHNTKRQKRGASTAGRDDNATKEARAKRLKVTCLLPRCRGDHLIKNCTLATPEEKEKYLNIYFEEKKKKKAEKRSLKAVVSSDYEEKSTMFRVTFINGAVFGSLIADIGSDANVLPPHLFKEIVSACPSIRAQKISPPMEFNLAVLNDGKGNLLKVSCSKRVELDTALSIRHGSALLLRRLDWLVCDQNAEYALLGRPLLERLGINARELLKAACLRHDGSVDVQDLMKEDFCNMRHTTEATVSSLHSGIYHGTAESDDDQLEDSDLYIDLGEDCSEELEFALQRLISSARSNGLSEEGSIHLKHLIMHKYRSIFRLKLGKSEPAKVKPMEIVLKSDKVPVKVKARRYSREQREFMSRYVNKLVEIGFLKPNRHAAWQCAPLLVRKTGSKAKYRMTIDLRPINSATVKEKWPMPHIDSEILDMADGKCFAKIDFVSGYWQLPVHPNSQSLCGIVTPNGVYTSNRVLQGLTNATSHFQGSVEPLFASIRENLKAWLDDFIIYAENESKLLTVLEQFLNTCKEHSLFLSAKKCELYKSEIKWCGRIISREGYRLEPNRSSALQNWSEPLVAGELCEFIHCCRWMAINIPLFTERVEVLNNILEKAYTKSKKRTKKSIANISLRSLSWGIKESAAFRSIQESIRNSVTLAHPKKDYVICVYTDASEDFWSAILTQTTEEQLELPKLEQKHEPLAFLGGKFKDSESRWSMYEKEGFSILSVFRKLDYILYGSEKTHVFTDHRNLLFVFCPFSIEPSLGRHVITKVQRWALYLSRFNYVIEHIPGSENIFADILTRWLKGYRRELRKARTLCSLKDVTGQIVPSLQEKEFTWPDMNSIKNAQSGFKKECEKCYLDGDGIYRSSGRVYVPKSSLELKLKLLVVSHCGHMGHRGQLATESVLSEEFVWESLKEDVKEFVNGCIHCLMTRTGETIPRPLGRALHGTKPNEVVHLDFLYMGSSFSTLKYLLLMKDDLSGYVSIKGFESANAEAAAELVSQWVASFGCMKWIVTDQGSHFANELIHELTKEYKVKHHFTTAYSPWANGSIERVCREVLRACRALLSEWRLAPQDWPSVIGCIQSILNHCPLKRLGLRDKSNSRVYRTPLECFCGIAPLRPLLRALPLQRHPQAYCTSYSQALQLSNIEKTQQALEEMHRSVSESTTKRLEQQVRYHNIKTNVRVPNLREGDFVLVRRAQKRGHKLGFVWIGPRRIVNVKSSLVFEVENLLSKKKETVHARRIILYRADMDGLEVTDRLLHHAEHTETAYETAKKMHEVRQKGDGFEILVEWDGLPGAQDWTWEPIKNLVEDVPDMTREFLDSEPRSSLKEKAKEKALL